MLRIRFLRTGKKNQPFFRIVVCDKKNPPRGGRFLEIVGSFNPLTKEKQLKADRIKHWLSKGAQPSDRVHNILVGEGIVKEKKKPVHAKSKKKKEGEPAEGVETAAPKQGETVSTVEVPAEKPKEQASPEKPAEPKKPEKPEEPELENKEEKKPETK